MLSPYKPLLLIRNNFAKNLWDINMLDDTTRERIQTEVDANDVLLFMKGTPVFPQCGFSAAVIQVLSHLQVKFSSVNVLEDPDVRDGIKQYSDWPTIPQLYVKGEFVGGCDIIREMYETGELKTFLEEKGLHSEPAA
jgi:monothiol glutaredoxin